VAETEETSETGAALVLSGRGTANSAIAAIGSNAGTNVPGVVLMPAPDIPLYQVSDHQLNAMEEGKHDALMQVGWAMLALFVGAVPSVIPAISKAYFRTPSMPMGAIVQIQFGMVILGLLGTLMCFIISASRGKRVADVFEQIRPKKLKAKKS
jgi:hypothetical protein